MSDLITIHTNGLEEAIRCAICENRIKSERGCDGSCRYDEKLLKRIIEEVNGCIEEQKRPRGEWIPTDEMGYMVRCSNCNFITHDDVSEEYKFCPNCGADMRESPSEVCRKKGEQIMEWFLQGLQGMKEGEDE